VLSNNAARNAGRPAPRKTGAAALVTSAARAPAMASAANE
jgi:hypothetical protein